MGIIEALVAALKAIPALKDILQQIANGISGLMDEQRKAREQQWLNNSRELAKRIEDAKTDEQRKELARQLSQHWNNQP